MDYASLESNIDKIVNNCVQKLRHSTLYHYADLAAAKSIISNQTFWATAHDCVNDKNELQCAHATMREVAIKFVRQSDAATVAFELFLRNYREGRFISDRRIMFLSCFCAQKDDPYLWKNYAGDGEGLCLAIPVLLNEPPPQHVQRFSFLAEVIYSEKTLYSKVRNAFGKVSQQLRNVRASDAEAVGIGLGAAGREVNRLQRDYHRGEARLRRDPHRTYRVPRATWLRRRCA